ncbi:MAG: endolytic transglycosylase MltG [Clostridia bacterium]|nr:endolytic transglycosylase MltG [Clostridia bacterium]
MNDNNRPYRPDPSTFRVDIDDASFVDPNETINSINGTQRISFTPDVLDENNNLNPYISDSKERADNKEHKRRDKIKSHKNRRIFRIVWIAMVVLLALTLAGYLSGGANDFLAAKRSEGNTTVEIPEKVTAKELSEILKTAGAIEEPEFFEIYCMLTTKMDYFEKGTYTLETNMDYEAIINYLQAGDTAERKTVSVTFQEGMTVREMAAKLEEYEVCSAEEFEEACKSDDFDNYDMIEAITNKEDKYYKLEGYLFPDTYEFYVDDDIESVIGKMLYNYQIRVTSDIVEDIGNSDYTMDQIITLASIIQAEAANTEDMYVISAILQNRLNYGEYYEIYTLGCDSTLFYPYSDKEDAPADFESNYSTYSNSGLPAGAICNPSIDAIKAAVRPSPTASDYYYFCHDAEGNAYYASSFWEHEQNMAKAGLTE